MSLVHAFTRVADFGVHVHRSPHFNACVAIHSSRRCCARKAEGRR